MKAERIQKVLSQAGIGSRRQIEAWIREGRISVDGKPAEIGQPVTIAQRFTLNGKPLRLQAASATRVLLLNKPEGVICTRSDPEGRPTVFEYLPRAKRDRWVLVGRLDINTSGLLLATNNGELANRLMHPSSEIEREYAVRVLGQVTPDQLHALTEGIELDDGIAAFSQISEAGGSGSNRWYHVTLAEGRNREVRRLWQAVGLTVSRLIRVRYGSINLPRIQQGQWKELTPTQLSALMKSVGLQEKKEKDDDNSKRRSARRGQGRKQVARGRPDDQQSRPGKGRKTSRQPARRRSRR